MTVPLPPDQSASRERHRYFARDGRPISQVEWARSFDGDRAVAKTDCDEEVSVSTVYLGLNQFGSGPPLIFETMIFGGDHDGWQARFSTEEQAAAAHESVVTALREGREPDA